MSQGPYRESPTIGTCPLCQSPGVVLHSYQYPDPNYDPEWDQYAQKMVEGHRCALCRDLPSDPRLALCYLGNLILKAIREK